MSKKRKRLSKIEPRVAKAIDSDKSIPIPHLRDTNGFNFFSIYSWLDSTDEFFKTAGFTNYLKDADEFSKLIYELIQQLIPKLYCDWEEIFNIGSYNAQFTHCHLVEPKHKDLVVSIAETINKTNLSKFDGDENQWWQIGFGNSVRLYGVYNPYEHAFYPMFCDWHHLINSSVHYNDKDFKQYHYSPKKIQ